MATEAQIEALKRARAAKQQRQEEPEQPDTNGQGKTYRVRYKGSKQNGILLEFPMPFEQRSLKTGEVRLNPEGELTEEQYEQFRAVVGESELFELM